MVRFIETIVILTLILFSFFVGVKYSSQVKENIGWLLEIEEVIDELPEMRDKPIDEINQNSDSTKDIQNTIPTTTTQNSDIN